RTMGDIQILNNSDGVISVSITTYADNGEDQYFDIQSRENQTWSRTNPQTCVIYNHSNGRTQIMTLYPGQSYYVF
ncbi:hypothetical protein EV363DRAFT_1187602, partial [Boletus edulis]